MFLQTKFWFYRIKEKRDYNWIYFIATKSDLYLGEKCVFKDFFYSKWYNCLRFRNISFDYDNILKDKTNSKNAYVAFKIYKLM